MALFVNLSSRVGGSLFTYATLYLSFIHYVKTLAAAIGKRSGNPIPYIKAM
jgi:hypothetical protein